MSTGTLIFVFGPFPEPWPTGREVSLHAGTMEGTPVRLLATPDGRLVFERGRQDHVQQDVTAPVRIITNGVAIIAVTWSPDTGTTLEINNTVLLGEAADATLIELRLKPIARGGIAWEDPDANTACAGSVRGRARTYGAQDSIPLTTELERLRQSQLALADYCARVRGGESYHWDAIRAQLRQLVVNLGRDYKPTLLRVAGRLGLPLPVYVRPESTMPLQPDMRFQDVGPHLSKEGPMVVTDLEQVLRRFVVAWVMGERELRRTVAEVLADAANQVGGAHQSTELSASTTMLSSWTQVEQSMLESILMQTAECVVALIQVLLDGTLQRLAGSAPSAP